jgi:hypothetical protein
MTTLTTLITQAEWLALPTAELAAQVWPHRVAVLLTSDGTRRHYLLRHPEENGRITNYPAYIVVNYEISTRKVGDIGLSRPKRGTL